MNELFSRVTAFFEHIGIFDFLELPHDLDIIVVAIALPFLIVMLILLAVALIKLVWFILKTVILFFAEAIIDLWWAYGDEIRLWAKKNIAPLFELKPRKEKQNDC